MPQFRTPLPDGMTTAHRKFCELVVAGNSQKAAAIAAGFSPRSAHSTGARLMGRGIIRAHIETLRAELAAQDGATEEALTEKLRRSSMWSALDFMVDDGGGVMRWKRPSELTVEQRDAIVDVRIETFTDKATGELTQTYRYILDDRKAAREALARVLGMNRDKVQVEHSGKVSALFTFVARHPETSDPRARLRARLAGSGSAARDGHASQRGGQARHVDGAIATLPAGTRAADGAA